MPSCIPGDYRHYQHLGIRWKRLTDSLYRKFVVEACQYNGMKRRCVRLPLTAWGLQGKISLFLNYFARKLYNDYSQAAGQYSNELLLLQSWSGTLFTEVGSPTDGTFLPHGQVTNNANTSWSQSTRRSKLQEAADISFPQYKSGYFPPFMIGYATPLYNEKPSRYDYGIDRRPVPEFA